jgi:hypothetical protein
VSHEKKLTGGVDAAVTRATRTTLNSIQPAKSTTLSDFEGCYPSLLNFVNRVEIIFVGMDCEKGRIVGYADALSFLNRLI